MPNNRQAKAERGELSGLSAAELQAQLAAAKRKLWEDSFALGKRQLDKTADLGKTRKRIARIQTYLSKLTENQ